LVVRESSGALPRRDGAELRRVVGDHD
jgi:hypothetical protein